MPITKRYLYDSYLYGPPDLYEESSPQTILQDIAMSQTLGTLHQLRYLAMYSVEIFDNLSRLSIDLSDRIQMITIKTNSLITKIPHVEKKVRSLDITQIQKKKKTQKFRSKEPYIPSILTKNTNSSQIRSQYSICNIMPQLWKMETIVPDDCVIKYSHPGLFFEEWLKVEIMKQDELRKEKKKAKEERKKLREEKRKKRLEEDEKQVATMSARDRAKAKARQLKEEKRKEKERAAKEAEENRRRIAVSRPTLTTSSLEPHFSAPPSSPPSIPSKPTTLPPTPQEPKPRYPPDTISTMPTTLPVVSKEKESRHISDPSSMSEKKSSKLDPLPGKTELPVERKSSSSVPRSRAPTFDDLDPPPDDLPPPDGYPAKTPLFIVLDDIPPPDDEIPPPDDDLLPPPDDDLPPPNDDFPNPEEGPPLDDLPSSPMDELPPPDDLEPPPSDFLHSTPPIQKIPQIPASPSRPPSPPEIIAAPEPTHAPLPPKPAPKARRKSILDMKADKKAVIAAATENLKSLNTLVEERESEDLKEADLVRDSIQSFSKPFSTHRIDEEDHESGRDSPPAIEYTLPPRRASIRIPSHPPDGIPQRRSSVAKASLSQTTPLTASELKRGSRNSTIVPFNSAADDEHAMYATTSAHAAQETVEAMSSLLGDSYQPQEVTSPEEGYSQEYQYQEDHYQNYGNGNDYHDPNYYDQYNQYYDQGDQTSYYDNPETALDELPPMEEQPVHVRQQSSLAIFSDGSILGEIRTGKVLRKAAPPPPKERSARETSLDLIKSGGVQLKRAEPVAPKAPEQRSGAIAAILSNRAQIAGSDSDSDSSDSDFSDDDLF